MSLSSSAPWLKYYGNVPHHLSYPQKTIYQMVKAAAERNPKLPAYEFMGKKTTFTQFMQKIDETAQAFLAMGIKKGDRVTICMPNCPQALHAFYGLNRIGAVSNMIHPLSAAGEIRFYLNFSHSKCILTLDQFYAKIAPIMPELDDPDCKLLLAKIEDELYPHLALGYALTAARKYPKPPEKGQLHLVVGIPARRQKARPAPAERVRQGGGGRVHPLFRRHDRHDQGHSPVQYEL